MCVHSRMRASLNLSETELVLKGLRELDMYWSLEWLKKVGCLWKKERKRWWLVKWICERKREENACSFSRFSYERDREERKRDGDRDRIGNLRCCIDAYKNPRATCCSSWRNAWSYKTLDNGILFQCTKQFAAGHSFSLSLSLHLSFSLPLSPSLFLSLFFFPRLQSRNRKSVAPWSCTKKADVCRLSNCSKKLWYVT